MKLSNALIIRLGNHGLMSTSEHDLPGDSAYIAFRWRRDAMKAYRELADRQAALRTEAGEDDARFDELNGALLRDTSEVEVSPMPVRDFLLLAAENRRTLMPSNAGEGRYVDFYRLFENELEGILWEDKTE